MRAAESAPWEGEHGRDLHLSFPSWPPYSVGGQLVWRRGAPKLSLDPTSDIFSPHIGLRPVKGVIPKVAIVKAICWPLKVFENSTFSETLLSPLGCVRAFSCTQCPQLQMASRTPAACSGTERRECVGGCIATDAPSAKFHRHSFVAQCIAQAQQGERWAANDPQLAHGVWAPCGVASNISHRMSTQLQSGNVEVTLANCLLFSCLSINVFCYYCKCRTCRSYWCFCYYSQRAIAKCITCWDSAKAFAFLPHVAEEMQEPAFYGIVQGCRHREEAPTMVLDIFVTIASPVLPCASHGPPIV